MVVWLEGWPWGTGCFIYLFDLGRLLGCYLPTRVGLVAVIWIRSLVDPECSTSTSRHWLRQNCMFVRVNLFCFIYLISFFFL
ncbi:hypothetical protein DFH27DRAFT_395339 [Peziza echinospora]|nr:hypothetical protein DFH27DRAFT_395339 [Peziza echinospora]